jgi:hypothetical protein
VHCKDIATESEHTCSLPQETNITANIQKELTESGSALAPTLADLSASFNASITLVSAPALSQDLTAVGEVLSGISTADSVWSQAFDFFSQLGSLWG